MPSLTVEYSSTQNITNNTSEVKAIVYLHEPYNINFSASKSGSITLNGVTKNFSTSGRYSGAGKWPISTQTFTVGHDSNGAKSFTYSAYLNIDITYSNSKLSRINTSGSGSLPTIPRASTISAISGNQIGSAITVTIARASTSFTHHVYYIRTNGSKLAISTTAGTSAAFTPAASDAALLPNHTSGNARIQVDTVSGGRVIGSTTRDFTIHVPNTATYNPSIDSVTTAIAGTGRDKAINQYVQTISKVAVTSTNTMRQGAKVKSETIVIRRKSDSKDSRTYSGKSTTSYALALDGVYTIIISVTDTRGRSVSTSRDITVQKYAPPSITGFKAVRKAGTATTVSFDLRGTFTPLGTSNPATAVISRTPKGGVTTVVKSFPARTTAYNDLFDVAGNLESSSYDFTVEIKDTFGNPAKDKAAVSTSKIALTVKRDVGIGVGKVWERGALDVGGDAYFDKPINATKGFNSILLPDLTNLNDVLDTGFYYCDTNAKASTISNKPSNQAFSLLVEKHAGHKQTFTIFGVGTPNTWVRNYYYENGWGAWTNILGDSGVNGNGRYVRTPDGTQIAWQRLFLATYNSLITTQGLNIYQWSSSWTYPIAFSDYPTVQLAIDGGGGRGVASGKVWSVSVATTAFGAESLTNHPTVGINLLAVGRWK